MRERIANDRPNAARQTQLREIDPPPIAPTLQFRQNA